MHWLNLAVFLALIAGNCELLAAADNRLHGLRLPLRVLKPFTKLSRLWMLLFPVLLVWLVGFRGPGLLRGGEWSHLHPLWAGYLSLCGLGFIGLAASAVRHWLYRPAAMQHSNHCRVVDIAGRLGRSPIGAGPYQALIRVPGNQAFQLDVSEKTFAHPDLPGEWDGLSILHLSDFHFIGTVDRAYFEQVIEIGAELQPDLIAFTGDLLDRQELIAWVPETLGRLHAPLGCYFVLGNHDWYLAPDATRRSLTEFGWVDVAGQTVTVEHRGKPLLIGGTEKPWMGRHPDFSSAPTDAFRLLLSHTPDNVYWAREQGVHLLLAGHNHGGQIRLPVLGPIYSPSLYGCRFASGVFWQPPTLMHVSRGVSGKQPIRVRCLPEITRIVLTRGEKRVPR